MSKVKGVVLGEHHLDAARKTVTAPTHGQMSRGVENLPPKRQGRADFDRPPAHTNHPTSVTKQENFHAGFGDTHGGSNTPQSSAMDLDRDNAMIDSPASRGRQMPDKHATSKAAEVRDAISEIGSGADGFPRGGSMSERR